MQRTCAVCGRKFYAVKEVTGKHNGKNIHISKYCSRDCWANRNPKSKKDCLYCGKSFESYQRGKKYCSVDCRNKGMVGSKASDETKLKMSIAKKGKLPKNHWLSGPLHPMWNPDRTDYRERYGEKYKLWKYAVFKRDKYTCQICGDKRSSGKKFCIDHIKPFSLYPELRFEVNNGRVLCVNCHTKTDTYARKKPKRKS